MQASIPLQAVAEASRWFHVLVEAAQCDVTLPGGRRMAAFSVWRKVRACDASRAGSQALSLVAHEWSALGLGAAPALAVAATAPLSRLAAWAVRDSAPQWQAA